MFDNICRTVFRLLHNTVDSRYYDTAGIRKKYQYIQTINISSAIFNCLQVTGILKRYHNKQYFDISDIVITRVHCIQYKIQLFASDWDNSSLYHNKQYRFEQYPVHCNNERPL